MTQYSVLLKRKRKPRVKRSQRLIASAKFKTYTDGRNQLCVVFFFNLQLKMCQICGVCCTKGFCRLGFMKREKAACGSNIKFCRFQQMVLFICQMFRLPIDPLGANINFHPSRLMAIFPSPAHSKAIRNIHLTRSLPHVRSAQNSNSSRKPID